MKKNKLAKLLAIVVLITIAFTYILPWVSTRQIGDASAHLALSFEGIGQGLDPRGANFNINVIKSDQVLNAVIKEMKLEKKLTSKELRKLITITPNVNGGALGEITKISTIEGKIETVAHKIVRPNQFTIGVKDVNLPGPMTTNKILNTLLKSYEEYFKSKYLLSSGVEPTFTKKELLALDYKEMITAMDQEAEALVRYTNGFAKENQTYTSEKLKLSFNDLLVQATTVRDVNVSNLSGLVNSYVLTKEPGTRIMYEQSTLERAKVGVQKSGGKELTVNEIAAIYDNTSNFFFAGTEDANSGVALDAEKQENVFYDDLMNILVDSKKGSIDTKYTVLEIEKAIDKLANPYLTPEQTVFRTEQIMKGISDTYQLMADTRKKVELLAEENYETNIAPKINYTKANYSVNSLGSVVINFLLFLAIAVLIYMGTQRMLQGGQCSVRNFAKSKKEQLNSYLFKFDEEKKG